MKINPCPETHMDGIIEITDTADGTPLRKTLGDIGILIAEDGRIWVCVNGVALLRFKPFKSKTDDYRKENSDGK